MSSFICEHCKAEILDSPEGYRTECPHYPVEQPADQEAYLESLRAKVKEKGNWKGVNCQEFMDETRGR